MVGMGTTVRQVNKLLLKRDITGTIHVVSPSGECLREFVRLSDALAFAQQTRGYLKSRDQIEINSGLTHPEEDS